MNTLEGDKLIADFVGFKACKVVRNIDSGRYYDYFAHPNFSCIQEQEIQIEGENGWGLKEQDFLFIEDLKFHTSWDWLMPVGIKCLEIASTYQNHPHITEDIQNAASRFEIQQLYKAILEFIQWYNAQNKQP